MCIHTLITWLFFGFSVGTNSDIGFPKMKPIASVRDLGVLGVWGGVIPGSMLGGGMPPGSMGKFPIIRRLFKVLGL